MWIEIEIQLLESGLYRSLRDSKCAKKVQKSKKESPPFIQGGDLLILD